MWWGLSSPLELSMRLTKSEVKIINHLDMIIAADWVISPLCILMDSSIQLVTINFR